MRSIPVDVSNLKMIASGAEPIAVNKYTDGVRQDATETDEQGRPLVRISLFIITSEGAEELRVKVPAANVPKNLTALSTVALSGFVASPYVNNNRVAISYRAESVTVANAK